MPGMSRPITALRVRLFEVARPLIRPGTPLLVLHWTSPSSRPSVAIAEQSTVTIDRAARVQIRGLEAVQIVRGWR